MTRRVCVSLSLYLLLATSAWAQLASQTALVGTVTDSAGLVVPGAQVTAVNAGTKDTYEATTNAEGYYNIPFVRPGRYDVTVTLTGFQTVKATGVEVSSNQVVRTNAILPAGGVSESVDVTADAQVIDTDRATVSETIGSRAIVELPLSGRNVWNLASTTPGVLGGLNSDIGLSFRGAGQREIQNSLSLDGINSSSNLLAATSMRPIADAVTEIQVQTGSTSAEYGSYLGVHINVVTKSGTNTLHGSFFEFYQDDALDSRAYFESPALPKNPRERNQFGAQMDGPMVIPGLYDGRNKTFFMGAYEGVRGEAVTSPFGSVPTAAMRRGDFSEVLTTNPIRNPFTGLPFPGNIIPREMLSPTSLDLLQYYPEANRAGTASNLQAPSANSDNVDQVLAKVDQNLGNKIRLNVRYNWHDSFNGNVFNAAIPVTAVTQPRVNKNWLFSYTHTLRPNLLNDFRIGYHRIDFDTVNPFYVSGPADAGTSLGIPGFDGDTRYANPGLPSVNVSNFSGLSAAGTNWYQFDTTFQVSNVLSYNRGSHKVRTGFDLRRLATGRQAANDPRGRFDFTGDISGYSVADFMLGLPRTVIPPTDQLLGHVGGWRNGFFINDTWQVSRNVTLNLGLRYELNTPVQTYTGLATMLAEDLTTIIPSTLPSRGLQVPRSELQRHRAPARRHVPPRRKDRRSRRLRDLLQPESDELVHVPDEQPAAGRSDDVYVGPGQPDVVVLESHWSSGTGGASRRHLADARSPQRAEGPVELRRAARARADAALDFQYIGSNTSHLDRSFFNNTPAPGAWRRRSAAAKPGLPQPPHDPERPHRRLRRLQHHPEKADEPRRAG